MVTFRYLSLVLVILFFWAAIFPQAKKSSRDEYLDRFLAAHKKARGLSYKNIQTTNIYKNEKLNSTKEFVYEFALPDRSHSILTETANGKTDRIEEISIGRHTQYCKRGNAPWKIENYCIHLLDGFLDPILHLNGYSTRPVITSYTVEKTMLDGKEVKRYREYIESMNYKDWDSVEKRKQWLSFLDDSYILNEEGLMLSEEKQSGMLNPKRIDEVVTDIYIYDPNIKIEAPIK
jgi:hypothetical protein